MKIEVIIHSSITKERARKAINEYFYTRIPTGFCLACGSEQECNDANAKDCKCKTCGESMVYGIKRILKEFTLKDETS